MKTILTTDRETGSKQLIRGTGVLWAYWCEYGSATATLNIYDSASITGSDISFEAGPKHIHTVA